MLLEQDLRRCSIERDRPHQIDNANEQRHCRHRSDEQPIAPNKIQILPQIERALEWPGVKVSGYSKSDVHQSIFYPQVILASRCRF